MHPLPAFLCLGLLAVPAHGAQETGSASLPVRSSEAAPAAFAPRTPQEVRAERGGLPLEAPPAPADAARPHIAVVSYSVRIEDPCNHGPRDPRGAPGAERARKRGAHMMLLRRLLLDKYDHNGDDLIDGDERRELLRDAHEAKSKALRALIARFDKDGDGKLDAAELDALQRAVQPAVRIRTAMRSHAPGVPPPSFEPIPPPPPEAGPVALLVQQLLIANYDGDGDGKLSETERRAVDADAQALFDDRTRALLARFDTDGDGKLGPDELRRARRQLREERELGREFNDVPSRPDPIDMYLNTYYDMDVIRSLDAEPEPS